MKHYSLIALSVAASSIAAIASETDIHQGYSETAPSYEVDGHVISNVDIHAPLWNPRGKTDEQIKQRAMILAEMYDAAASPERRASYAKTRQRYQNAFVINAIMPGAVGLVGYEGVDFERAMQRNIDAGVNIISTSVYNFPSSQGEGGLDGTLSRTDEVLNNMKLTRIESLAELEKLRNTGETAVIFNTQGADFAIDDLGNVEKFREAGVMQMNFTYNNDNALATGGASNFKEGNSGITELGKKFIEVANEKGVVIDVSHSSNQTAIDAAKYSKNPVIASHSNSMALHKVSRNLTDEAMLAIADSGGVVCSVGAGLFLNKEGDASPEAIAEHVEYTGDLIGRDKTCFASDFVHVIEDFYRLGIKNFDMYPPEKGFGSPTENAAVEDIWGVVQVLESDHGWSEDEIRGFLGENLIAVYQQVW